MTETNTIGTTAVVETPATQPVETAVVVAAKPLKPLLPIVANQMDMFGNIFKTANPVEAAAMAIKDGKGGRVWKLGKRDQLQQATGLVGDELDNWERSQRDKLMAKAQAAFNAAITSGNYTFGTFRSSRAGNLGVNLKLVGRRVTPLESATKEQLQKQLAAMK